MKNQIIILFFSLLIISCFFACGSSSSKEESSTTQTNEESTDTSTVEANSETTSEEPKEQVYSTRGQVISVKATELTIDHEEIVDYMEAMRMDLTLEDSTEVEGLSEGDKISFDLVQKDQKFFIRNIEKLSEDTELELPETQEAQ